MFIGGLNWETTDGKLGSKLWLIICLIKTSPALGKEGATDIYAL